MKTNIKAAFFDLDGTLFSKTFKAIPSSTYDALAMLQANGIKIFLATGRHASELKKLPIKDIPFDGYVLLNGQIVLDKNFKRIDGTPFDEETTKGLVKIFNKKENPIFLVEEEDIYVNFINDYVIRVQEEINTPLPEIKEYTGKPIYMGVAYLKKEEEPIVFKDLPNTIEPTRWNEDGVDIISKGEGKTRGIKQLLAYLNISRDEIIAFGDGENDITMLEYAGIGVGMGNSMEEVKKHIDYLTDDIDNDGVFKALKHFKLI